MVGVGVLVGTDVGTVVGVGVGVADEPLKIMVGGLLLVSVTAKLLVVSWIVKVSVPAFCDVRLKVAIPFWA